MSVEIYDYSSLTIGLFLKEHLTSLLKTCRGLRQYKNFFFFQHRTTFDETLTVDESNLLPHEALNTEFCEKLGFLYI